MENGFVLGDCLDPIAGLPSLAGKSVDHTISDPPYAPNCHENQFDAGGGIKAKKTKLDFAALQAGDAFRYAQEIVRVTKGWIALFCAAEMVGDWKTALELAGAKWRRTCFWVKPDSRPQLSGDRPAQGAECIVVAWCGEGRSVWNGRGKLGLYYASIPRGKYRLHPTQKPVSLMEDLLLDFTSPNDLILDPFAGVATTGVACYRWGRRFMGYELDAKYHKLGVERLATERRQISIIQPIIAQQLSLASLSTPEASGEAEYTSPLAGAVAVVGGVGLAGAALGSGPSRPS